MYVISINVNTRDVLITFKVINNTLNNEFGDLSPEGALRCAHRGAKRLDFL